MLGCGEAYVGKKCYEVLQGLDRVCPFCRNECLTGSAGTHRWDHYNDRLGVNFQLQDRRITFAGRPARFEIAVDISARESRQLELTHALDEQRMLAACTRTLNGRGARAMRALNRPDAGTVPIIAMTADAFADDIQRCLDACMNGHVAKPIEPAKFYEALNRHIAR